MHMHICAIKEHYSDNYLISALKFLVGMQEGYLSEVVKEAIFKESGR